MMVTRKYFYEPGCIATIGLRCVALLYVWYIMLHCFTQRTLRDKGAKNEFALRLLFFGGFARNFLKNK